MPSKTTSILIGALLYAVIGAIAGFLAASASGMQFVGGALGCLAITIGTGGAVWHYTSTHRLTIPAGPGAALGAAAGAVGAVISWLLQQLLQMLGLLPDPIELARRQMEGQGLSDEQIEAAMGMTELFSGPLGIVVGVVVAAVIGAVVGALAAVIFKKGSDGFDPELDTPGADGF